MSDFHIQFTLVSKTVYTVNKAELVGHYDFAKSVSGEYMVQIDGTYGKMEGCIQVTAEVRQDA